MIQSIPSSKKIFEAVVKLASENLKAKDDLERLIIIAVDSSRIDLLEDLAFQAKYIMGLIKVIQTRSIDHNLEYLTKLNEEFNTAYSNVQNLIRDIIQEGSQFIKEIFEEKYLKLTQESLDNLNTLCQDLSLLKLVFNDFKTKKDPK